MYELSDDMDELFRRAANEYPLNTNSADWNKVFDALQKDEKTAAVKVIPGSKTQLWRRLFWVFLLFPLAWMSHNYGAGINNNDTLSRAHFKQDNDKHNLDDIKKKPAITTSIAESKIDKYNIPLLAKNGNNIFIKDKNNLSKINSSTNNDFLENNEPTLKKDFSTDDIGSNNKESISNVVVDENNTNTKEISIAKDSLKKKTTPETTKSIILPNKKVHGFYIGVLGGADLSSVKYQSIKNIGLNAGVLIGYQLNKRFSVETGANWNKKYYYTKGEYYNPKNDYYLSLGSKLETVTGNCGMIEWPINIRYHFKKSANNSEWSIVAGSSSYFMKKENYLYTYNTNGQYYDWDKTYNNSSNNWFSVMNVGFTYSRQLGRTGSLRVEPYFKLPISGVGSGRLPIMSSGINLGFIKKLF